MDKEKVNIKAVSGLPLRPYLDDIWNHMGVIDSEITDLQNNGGGGGTQDAFTSIPVNGQTTVTADDPSTALTFIAGTNMTITTNNTTKAITFASVGVAGASDIDGGDANTITYVAMVDGGGA